MRKCNRCNKKFSLLPRVKSLNKQLGEMKCYNCKTIYRRKSNISVSLSCGLTGFLCVYIGSVLSEVPILFRCILGLIISLILISIFTIISSYLVEYEAVE